MMHRIYKNFKSLKKYVKHLDNNISYIVNSLFFTTLLTIVFASCSEQERVRSNYLCSDSLSAVTNLDTLKSHIRYFKEKNDQACLAASYNKMGKIYQDSSRFAEAIEAHLKGLVFTEGLDDTLGTVRTLNAIGDNFRQIGEFDQASYYYYQSFTLSKTFSKREELPMLRSRVESLNGIGFVFVRQANWKMADSAYNSALKCETTMGNLSGQAACYANLGQVFESTNQLDSAWAYYKKSLILNVEVQSHTGIALCRLHFGHLYEKQGKWDMAMKEYSWANEVLSKSEEKWYWMKSLLAIARIYKAQHNDTEMIRYLNIAEKTAKRMGSIQVLTDVYKLYYEWYKEKGDHKKALDNYVLSKSYEDSIMNLVKLNQMFNTRLKFMLGNHEDEMKSMKSNYTSEKNLRRMMMVFFLVLSLVVTAIIITLSYLLHNKRKMTTVMGRMERIRSDFFTNVTHEFRTPLSVILGLGERMENDPESAKNDLQRIGRVINYQGNQLLDMVNQLLDVSKIQSSIGNPRWCRGNVVAFIDMLVENFQELAQKKHLELVFLSKEKAIEMEFVTEYMNKIVKNLLSNAYKFTPEYGKIYLTASAEKEDLVLYVADSGQGISDVDLPHIFDPFYQGNNSSLLAGSGVGLSLVHQLVQAMNGSIEVKSSPNEGTVFILKFPLKRSTLDQTDMDVYTPSVHKNGQNMMIETQDLPNGQKLDEITPLILIVEDNTDVAYYIGSQLQKNYTLKYARNGRIALEMALDLIPDIILSDVIMPEMDGYALCRSIRESQILNHIPIILISVLNSEAERMKGLEAGSDVYLTKPFNSNELNERIEFLLEQRRMLRLKFSQTQTRDEESQLSDSDQQFLNKLTDVTYAVMASGNVTVEEIASKMLMSRQQINRKIHAITGENTLTYLTRIRLNKAKMLLDSPQEYLVGDIAMKCGFDDIAYFSRIFKKTFNVTPSQYRRRLKD